jgi:signal transduction histidine kinase
MSLFTNYRGNVRFWLKGYLFLGVAALTLVVLLYSNHLIGKMREHSESTSRLFSRYIANVLFEVSDDGGLADLRDVIRESNLPIIITVDDGKPILWHRVPLPDASDEMESMATSDEDFNMLITMDVNNPPTERLRRLVELYREYDRINDPIPIRVLGTNEPQGYVHFGLSPLQRELRLMPFVQLGIFLIFMAVAIQGVRYLKISEQRSIWVGMAKETAHQLGTPLSALLGWVQLIKDRAHEQGYTDIESSIAEMEVDLGRLEKVTDRFSKIGSRPEFLPVPLDDTVARTVAYFERRLPTRGEVTTIETRFGDTPPVNGNAELLEWVIENLIKNALDAIGEGGGRIQVETSVASGGREVEMRVRDSGRGVPASLRERIFHPGFTTKKRGWGLGLALTRRIVVDYHRGSIRLGESRAGQGTTFVVRLPVA